MVNQVLRISKDLQSTIWNICSIILLFVIKYKITNCTSSDDLRWKLGLVNLHTELRYIKQ